MSGKPNVCRAQYLHSACCNAHFIGAITPEGHSDLICSECGKFCARLAAGPPIPGFSKCCRARYEGRIGADGNRYIECEKCGKFIRHLDLPVLTDAECECKECKAERERKKKKSGSEKGFGKGWHGESRRHSNARRLK